MLPKATGAYAALCSLTWLSTSLRSLRYGPSSGWPVAGDSAAVGHTRTFIHPRTLTPLRAVSTIYPTSGFGKDSCEGDRRAHRTGANGPGSGNSCATGKAPDPAYPCIHGYGHFTWGVKKWKAPPSEMIPNLHATIGNGRLWRLHPGARIIHESGMAVMQGRSPGVQPHPGGLMDHALEIPLSRSCSPRLPATPELLTLIARRLGVLAEPARLAILHALEQRPLAVTELAEATGLGQGNLFPGIYSNCMRQVFSRLTRNGLSSATLWQTTMFSRFARSCVDVSKKISPTLIPRLPADGLPDSVGRQSGQF